jgi:hypothetical protein
METQAKNDIFKPKQQTHICTVPYSTLLHSLLTMREPKGFKFISKHTGWIAAMDEEIRALQHNQT